MAVYKTPNGSYKKRLKSLDEPNNIKIADTRKLNKKMNQLKKQSKTYKHNQEVLRKLKTQNGIKQKSTFIRILEKLARISFFCLKCIACFVIGAILLSTIFYIFQRR